MQCEEKRWLVLAFTEYVIHLVKARNAVVLAVGTPQFAEQCVATEHGRLECEKAQEALEKHRRGHGC
jgi:hypothetical protein